MKLVYMVQTEAELPDVFHSLLQMPDVTLLHLSFKRQIPGALYLPNSTWTEGRNALLAEAKALGQNFEYYVFCDDDLEFEYGSFTEFNAQVEETRPAIGVPLYDFAPNRHANLDCHTVYAFDALMNAFHRDLVADGVILPYHAGFDSKSWWFSQFFVIHLASVNYPDHILRLGRTCVRSGQSRPYRAIRWPTGSRSKLICSKRFLTIGPISKPGSVTTTTRHRKFHALRRLPAVSYRMTPEQLGKLKINGPFWAKGNEAAQ